MGFSTGSSNTNQLHNKSASSLVFAKRKPAFKIRIDSFRTRGLPTALPANNNSISSKSRKAVRIAENRNTVLFRHVLESELEQTWYQPKDYQDFKQDNRTTLNALHQVQGQLCQLDPQQHCIRGLEAHVNDQILRLRQTRIRSNVQVVLDQQRSQQLHGMKDETMISAVSMMFSKQSRQHALSMGALDQSLRGC
jgi:hypothetical protein